MSEETKIVSKVLVHECDEDGLLEAGFSSYAAFSAAA